MTKPISRRILLRRAASGAAAFGLPYLVPSRVFALDGSAPNSRLNVAIIGCGGMGNSHRSHISNLNEMQIVALCDVDTYFLESARLETEKTYAARFGAGNYRAVQTHGDFREVLERSDVDAVVIATPDHWHAIMTMAAARAGKDIYCEKPLSLTIREARAMVQEVRRYGRVCQTGSQQRSDNRFRFACELVRNGIIGQVHTVYVRVGGPSAECFLPAHPTPETLNWEMWLGPAPYRPFHSSIHPGNFRAYRDYSGGGTTDWGAHHFDIVQWALNMDNSGPTEINPPSVGQPLLSMRYTNGATVYHVYGDAAATVKWPSPPVGDDNGITFIGDKGWIEVDRGHLRTFPDNLARQAIASNNEVRLEVSPGHHQNWLDCIRSRKLPIADVEIGARSVTVCHLANIAYWLNRPLKWNPQSENFINDAQASRWLSRMRREPWGAYAG